MSVENHTPFSAMAFRQYNLAGEMLGVVVVRGTFLLTNDGPLALDREQAPLVLSDQYDGDDPHQSNLVTQGDLVPFKPTSDVTFAGAAYTDDGEPQASWTCGLTVGPVHKDLRVHGPRYWVAETGALPLPFAGKRNWRLSAAQPVPYVVLGWDKAYGGPVPAPEDAAPERFEANPLGCGIVNDHIAGDVERVPAPQIEAIDQPIASPSHEYAPENLAPIPPFWPQRLEYAGTYDDDWIKDRHPLLPKDFEFRFWQCAHPDLITETWLTGDESFELRNLLHRYPVFRGRLPGIKMQMELARPKGIGVAPLVLDGVHFDMRPGVGRVFLTWRASFPWEDGRGLPVLRAVETLPEAV
ncbi:DUF2169 domain-containing protein [Paracoccaceae bacterium GXU_MW_L88]